MKKLITIILLLSFSLPALAAEQKILCTATAPNGHKSQITMTFDPDDKTIDGHKNGTYGNEYYEYSESELYINTEHFGYKVNRLDGTFRVYDRSDTTHYDGTCVKFTQAF